MELEAKKRDQKGKKLNQLRKGGDLPAIVYGREGNPQPIEVKQTDFEKAYREGGEATIIDLMINGRKEKVLITDVQKDPFGKILHADFQRVAAGKKLTTTVSITTTGESPAVKEGRGILLTLLDEVEIECYPQDLPSEIKVDISGLEEIDDAVAIKDLPIEREKIKILEHKGDELVVKISHAEMEEEEETTAAEGKEEEEAVEAVEATKEKDADEDEEALKTPEEKKQETKEPSR